MTGGAGYIGSILVPELLRSGPSIKPRLCLDSSRGAARLGWKPRIEGNCVFASHRQDKVIFLGNFQAALTVALLRPGSRV